MATKFYLTNAAADLDTNQWSATDEELFARLAPGAALATGVKATVTNGTQEQIQRTAGGNGLAWWSKPLDAVTLSGTVTLNLWMSESNMAANVGARVAAFLYDTTGTITPGGILLSALAGVELPVTTRAAQNWTTTVQGAPRAIAAGERILFVVLGTGVGSMASGFTFDLGFNGGTGGADGDSWVQFTETITEQTAAPQPPYRNPMPPLLAQ